MLGRISTITNFIKSIPANRIAMFVAVAAGLLIVLWLIDKIFIYYYAKTYIEEISSATGLNCDAQVHMTPPGIRRDYPGFSGKCLISAGFSTRG